MAESTLALTYTDLLGAASFYAGYGINTGSLSADQVTLLRRFIDAGVRKVLFPGVVNGTTHEWSWLKPLYEFSTVDGTDTYTMPDAFASLVGEPTLQQPDERWKPLRLIGEPEYRRLREQVEDEEGQPEYAIVQPVQTTSSTGTRWQVRLWPVPDAVYAVKLRYVALPDRLSASNPTNPYPPGGVELANLYKAAVLSEVERELNDVTGGPHQMEFEKLLVDAVVRDRGTRGGVYFGYNGDNSDALGSRRGRRNNLVTVNGVSYP